MAALYLHQALFAPEPSVPPVLAHTSPPSFRHGSSIQVDRHLSSVSSVTLRTASTSDYSHPTEPLLRPLDSEPSAYLDLLSTQPQYPNNHGTPDAPLALDGDPVIPSERRSRWERRIRRRLRRLRWSRRTFLIIIGAWTTYNAVRYYVAFAIYQYYERQVIVLTLGTSTALSTAFTLTSLAFKFFAPRLGWRDRPRAPHVVLQALLNYSSSVFLLGPAIVNFVFVFLWRHSDNPVNTLRGRCHWDIDVFWSGLGSACPRGPSWGFWLAGALVRLLLTIVVIGCYHLASYQYDVTRQPTRRRRRSRPHSDMSSPSVTATITSAGSCPTSTSAVSSPVSIPKFIRHPSISTSEGHATNESYGSSSEHRPLRNSRSRISAQSITEGKAREVYQLPSAASPKTEKEASLPAEQPPDRGDTASESSSEDLHASTDIDRYGRPMGHAPGVYATTPPWGPTYEDDEEIPQSSMSDSELSTFAERFRHLVAEISRETEEGIALAQSEYYPPTFPSMSAATPLPALTDYADDDYVPVLGRTVHRMPTIESLGSREMMSIGSQSGSSVRRASPGPHHMSRPSTRSNNLSVSEAGTSTPSTRSRANSLDAALALAAPPSSEDMGEEDGARWDEEEGDAQEHRPASHEPSSR
ncbi:hypothetical protein POSPLADRAFT_1061124 [Postia placenta MAD-698-R-SB12]|uniref:Uncharacterized protein n=1 Tax=Postia placenta MAD-698-R-SB12 TaxID=670580 RepID=A0A1X6MNX4_9APHY|nr:hypothetical protein POSPLADRAFT_1061124 [Postia placenta MAD-698-R-SB12]OSX58038.1 hypothetical protein POSPLADRAFT_1061124 [Postia placenta MAD-698-R-SB12]